MGGPLAEYLTIYLGLALLGPLLTALERRAKATPRSPAELRVDLAYWLLTPLLTGALARLLVFGVLGVLAAACGLLRTPHVLLERLEAAMPFARLPLLVQAPLALLVLELFAYWSHRLRHTRGLWTLHAIHHAPTELRALSAARLHPLDEILDTLLSQLPVVLLGFKLEVFALLGPLILLHTLLLHAALPWGFGPLGYLLASPRFHRRHHARDLAPANFGGVLAVFDLAFGTFELPAEAPTVFGVPEADVPPGLLGQLAYPLRQALRTARGDHRR